MCQFVLIAVDVGPSGSAHPIFPIKASFCIGKFVSDRNYCLQITKKCYREWDPPGNQHLSVLLGLQQVTWT